MFIGHLKDIDKSDVNMDGVKGVSKQVPIGAKEGWKDNTLRVFTIKAGGHTQRHSHEWEHVNYVISGVGTLEIDGKKNRFTTGTFAFVSPNTEHQFSNQSDKDLVMICIVPSRAEY